jgi:hypothetical protein
MWLAASGRFDLRVIHLVKDPRAFVYSIYRHASGLSRFTLPLRAAARWQIENRMFCAAANYLPPETVRVVRYEELARDPSHTISELCRWLEVPSDFASVPGISRVNHGIAGNPSRFGPKHIVFDEKWKAKLPWPWQITAYALNARLARSLGYGKVERRKMMNVPTNEQALADDATNYAGCNLDANR